MSEIKEMKRGRGGARPGAGRPRAPGESLEAARRRKETALADLRQLEVHARKGELLDAAPTLRSVEAFARVYRDTLLALPTAHAEQLSAELGVEVGRLVPALERLVREVLEGLSRQVFELAGARAAGAHAG
jgi:hypothetical protein